MTDIALLSAEPAIFISNDNRNSRMSATSTTPDRIIQRMERIPFGAFHSRLVVILGMGMLFDAFDVYVISVVAVGITAFKVTDATIGFIISASYVGQLIGSLLFGYASEVYGRKPAFIWALGSFGLLSLVAAFAWNVDSLIWTRVLQGFGIGALPPIAGAMFSEFLRAHRRGGIGMAFQMLYPVGATLSPLLGIAAFQLFGTELGWRALFLFGGLPFLLAIVAYFMLPESPRWLATRGRIAEADKIVSLMEEYRSSGGKELEPLPPPISADTRKTEFTELFSTEYIRRTVLIWVQSFTAFFIVNAFTSFLPRLYTTVGGLSNSQAFALTMVFGIMQFALLALIAFTWDRTGRKPWFVGGYGLAVVGAAVAWAAFAVFHSTGWITLATAGMLMALGTYVSVGGVYLYHPELFPTRMRSWATSTGRAIRSVASIVAPVLIGQILVSGLGVSAVFAMFFAVALVGFIAMAWLGVETKEAALEKIAA
jgi:MFS transporter, putative metabolite:H+ symporter